MTLAVLTVMPSLSIEEALASDLLADMAMCGAYIRRLKRQAGQSPAAKRGGWETRPDGSMTQRVTDMDGLRSLLSSGN